MNKFDKREKALRTFIAKQCAKRGLDAATFDAHAMVDLELSLWEQEAELRTKFGWIDEETTKAEVKVREREDYRSQQALNEQDLRAKEAALLEQVRETQDSQVSSFFEPLRLAADGFVNSNLNAFLCVGGPGTGKSATVLSELNKSKMPIQLISGHCTNLALYCALYRFRDGIVVMDDLPTKSLRNDSLLKAILKAATWSPSGQRVISWQSTSKILQEESVPTSFEFKGKVVILANELPNDDDFQAIKDRALVYEHRFSSVALKQLILLLARQPFGSLDDAARSEVADWVCSQITEAVELFSIRSLVKCLSLRQWSAERWKDVAKSFFVADPRKQAVLDARANFSKKGEQALAFMAETGLSRRTYYSLVKAMGI